jgi:hypothetical protein
VVLKLTIVYLKSDDPRCSDMQKPTRRFDNRSLSFFANSPRNSTSELDKRLLNRIGARIWSPRDHNKIDSRGKLTLAEAECLSH